MIKDFPALKVLSTLMTNVLLMVCWLGETN